MIWWQTPLCIFPVEIIWFCTDQSFLVCRTTYTYIMFVADFPRWQRLPWCLTGYKKVGQGKINSCCVLTKYVKLYQGYRYLKQGMLFCSAPMEIIKFCTCRSFLNNRNSIYIHDVSRWVPLLTASSIMYGSFVSTEIYQRCQFRNTKLQNITRVVLLRLQMCNYGCNKLSAEQKIIQYKTGTKDLPQKSC